MRKLWIGAFATLLLAACAPHRPIFAYRVVQSGTSAILMPPGIANALAAGMTFKVNVRTADGPCATSNGVLTIRKQHGGLLVTAMPATLEKQPTGWLARWAAGLESEGCIRTGEGLQLAQQVVESVPVDINAAFQLLHENRQARVEFDSQLRLQVMTPVLKDATAAAISAVTGDSTAATGGVRSLTVTGSSSNILGYEMAWYEVRQRPDRIGFSIEPVQVEVHLGENTEQRSSPLTNYFTFSNEAAFYRLLYKSNQADFTAMVVAGRTPAEVDSNTKQAESSSCSAIPKGFCAALPKQVAVNPFVAVSINGVMTNVHWGTTIAQAIRDAGERHPETVLPQLTISRGYKGQTIPVQFDPVDRSVLNMIVTGGERIAWKAD